MITAKTRYNSLIPKVSRRINDYRKHNYSFNESLDRISDFVLDNDDEDHDGLLHIAVVSENVHLVNELVNKLSKLYGKSEIDRLNVSLQTPLHLAVCIGNEKIIRSLVETGGASLHLVDRNGNNILHLAVKYEKLDCIRLLLTYLNNDQNGDCCSFEQVNKQLKQYNHGNNQEKYKEIEQNINIEKMFSYEKKHLMFKNHHHHHHHHNHQTTIHPYIYNDDHHPHSPHHHKHFIHTDIDKVNDEEEKLRKSRYRYQILNGLNKEGLSPLHLACHSHNFHTMIKTLVSGGVDIDVIDGLSGRTPLLYTLLSSNHNKGAIQKLLLTLNSDPWIADYSGNKPIDFLESISI